MSPELLGSLRELARTRPGLIETLIAPLCDAEVPLGPEEEIELDTRLRRVREGALRGGSTLSPIYALSFWLMKRRAGQVGERLGREWLAPTFTALGGKAPRLHLIGHSFGAKLLASAVLGGLRPESLVLLQAAFSAFAFAEEVPSMKRPGFYHRVLAERLVAGPIVALRAEHDRALGTLYPAATWGEQVDWAAPNRGRLRQVREVVARSAMGAVGVRGVGAPELDLVDVQKTGIPRRVEAVVKSRPLRAAAKRSYYSGTLVEFCAADRDEIFARMALQNDFDLTGTQRNAWLEEAEILHRVLAHHTGAIYLEFTIPRMGRRIDALVIIGPVIFVLEFKVGEQIFSSRDVDQVVDYALDLHNFHEGSHDAFIAPVLICTHARRDLRRIPDTRPSGRLFEVSLTNSDGLAGTIERILSLVEASEIQIDQWEGSGYKPTPTIIEATLALYRGHSVTEISRSDAGATNLSKTAGTVAAIIAVTKARSQKAICFVTGVPGAGKTLVGLDAATKHIEHRDELYSVFLSGNGPLVEILREALARDKVRQERLRGRAARKGAALSEVRAFIQNVHHFRDECLVDVEKPPIEHVAIFDEAQRAWNLKQTVDFMRRKKGRADRGGRAF
jgi:hypothetical protein